jgi:two-component system OmpR family sensor kinase
MRRIEETADRMSGLLSALSDSSRAAMGRLDLRPIPVDLAVLLHDAVARLGPDTTARMSLELSTGLDATGEWDPTWLEQVVMNLLSNAVKYSPADSPITVAVRADAENVEFSVRDGGIGIGADEMPRLLQRYVRGRSAVEHGINGLGLGLYLCRTIVEAHGGHIWAESEGPDQGTTMHVVLPRRTPSAPSGG